MVRDDARRGRRVAARRPRRTGRLRALVSGTVALPVSALLTVAIAFVGLLLGFAFLAALSAALASTVSRQEQVSGILTR